MTKTLWQKLFSEDDSAREQKQATPAPQNLERRPLSPYEAYLLAQREKNSALETKPKDDAEQQSAEGEDKLYIGAPLAEQLPPIKSDLEVSWLEKLRSGLSRSSKQLGENVSAIFTKAHLTEASLDSLEEVLLKADLGIETTANIIKILAQKRYDQNVTQTEVYEIMAQEIEKVLAPLAKPLAIDLQKKPYVIFVVGVNGTGKTTTIGKLAAKLHHSGLKVMLAAGDTFRAAAIEQLHAWGQKIGVEVVSKKIGSDAASLAYEAYQKAKESAQDVLIIDTAGRLQNKTELMEECAKMVRVLKKHDPSAPHQVLQILDATTGQNALRQVEVFQEFVGVNGLVMTKLDGSTRGGILVAIAAKFSLPIYFIGVGETIDDLEPFAAKDFSRAIVNLS